MSDVSIVSVATQVAFGCFFIIFILWWLYITTPCVRRMISPFSRHFSKHLRSGDLILYSTHNIDRWFRRQLVRLYSASEWSHIGLLVKHNNVWWVWDVSNHPSRDRHGEIQRWSPTGDSDSGFTKLDDLLQHHQGYLAYRRIKDLPLISDEQWWQTCIDVGHNVQWKFSSVEKLSNWLSDSPTPLDVGKKEGLSCYESVALVLHRCGVDLLPPHKGVWLGSLTARNDRLEDAVHIYPIKRPVDEVNEMSCEPNE